MTQEKRDIQRLELELHDLERTMEMWRKRSMEANTMWQNATGRYDTWADLGDLFKWLMDCIRERDQRIRDLEGED